MTPERLDQAVQITARLILAGYLPRSQPHESVDFAFVVTLT